MSLLFSVMSCVKDYNSQMVIFITITNPNMTITTLPMAIRFLS